MQKLWFFKSVIQTLWRDRHYSTEQFAQFQRRRLTRLLSSARERVPFQQERLRHLSGTNPNLRDVAPTNKSEMMRDFDRTLSDRRVTLDGIKAFERSFNGTIPLYRKRIIISKTSGTTGEAGYFVGNLSDWSEQRGAVFARTLRDRLSLAQVSRFMFGRRFRIAFLLSDYRYAVSYQSAMLSQQSSKLLADIRVFPVDRPIEQTIRELNAFQPHYLHAFPSVLESALQFDPQHSPLTIDPEIISLGSEGASPRLWELLGQRFPNAVRANQYGSTECVPLANSCAERRLHLNPDFCIIEPVDEEDRPVAPGEFSHHILLTNLINTLQPMIRYRIDDTIRILPDRCPCGRPTATIEIQGRREDHFYVRDNNSHWHRLPALGLCINSVHFQGVAQSQFVHRRQNEIVVRVVVQRGADPMSSLQSVKTQMVRYLSEHHCEQSVRVVAELTDQIERNGPGQKLRHVVSLVEPPNSVARVA